MWFLESLLQCHPYLLTLLARRHWSCCYHWEFIIHLTLQLPTVLFLVNAAPLLKKNGIRCFRQDLSTPMTHASFIGRAPGPLSPPTMTQSKPLRFTPLNLRSGVRQKENFMDAAVLRSRSMRGFPCFMFSTLTPHQICGDVAANFNGPDNSC